MSRIFVFILCFFLSSAYSERKMIFTHETDKGETLTIAAVGDILLHYPLQIAGLKNGFDTLWQVALPTLQNADIAYANLEGPINDNNNIGKSFPQFGYPNSLAIALKQSGFDILSTANNHALDQYASGVNHTIEALKNAGINFTGTRLNDSSSWVSIINKNQLKVAWIACTEHTNGITDLNQQVLYCFKKNDRQWIIDTIKSLKNKVDIIIISPHWGEQYEYIPSARQIQFAHDLLNAGATAVIGSHPHVLQPAEKYITADGRETFILYSLGNFVSYQGTINNRTSIILLLNFIKNTNGTFIASMKYIPIYMQNRDGLERIRLEKITSKNTIANEILFRVLPPENAEMATP